MSTEPRTTKLRIRLLAATVCLAFLVSYLAQQWSNNRQDSVSLETNSPHNYQRIIGLAPSIVEVIYQLDLDDKLVGVSKFCKHPPEAAKKPTVGGYIDLNFEAVIRLKPDCVILLEEQQNLVEKLHSLNIDTILLDHACTEGVIESIHLVGEALDKKDLAKNITNKMRARIQSLSPSEESAHEKPRVLVCIGRDTSADHPSRIYAAGNKGVHQEYISMAGGTNVYQGSVAYPIISREKLIHLNPDIIIDLVSEETWEQKGEALLFKQWQSYSELKAVQNQNIVFLYENKHMIPGPRFVDTLEEFSKSIQSYGKN